MLHFFSNTVHYLSFTNVAVMLRKASHTGENNTTQLWFLGRECRDID